MFALLVVCFAAILIFASKDTKRINKPLRDVTNTNSISVDSSQNKAESLDKRFVNVSSLDRNSSNQDQVNNKSLAEDENTNKSNLTSSNIDSPYQHEHGFNSSNAGAVIDKKFEINEAILDKSPPSQIFEFRELSKDKERALMARDYSAYLRYKAQLERQALGNTSQESVEVKKERVINKLTSMLRIR